RRYSQRRLYSIRVTTRKVTITVRLSAGIPPSSSFPGSAGPCCRAGRPRTRTDVRYRTRSWLALRPVPDRRHGFPCPDRPSPASPSWLARPVGGLDGFPPIGPEARVLRPGLGGLFGFRGLPRECSIFCFTHWRCLPFRES